MEVLDAEEELFMRMLVRGCDRFTEEDDGRRL